VFVKKSKNRQTPEQLSEADCIASIFQGRYFHFGGIKPVSDLMSNPIYMQFQKVCSKIKVKSNLEENNYFLIKLYIF